MCRLITLSRPPSPPKGEAHLSSVFVLDTHKQQLNPVHPGRARILLEARQAAVYRRYPFTIILKKTVESPAGEPLRIKLDPGSKTTGIAIVNDASGDVVFAAELTHRGQAIKSSLDERRASRRSRRGRHTRYRKPRFLNRRRRVGWLPPSLESRIAHVITWVRRLMRVCPITSLTQELVKFDLQAMENPEMSGVEYQQGTLMGYEVREYLLEKWNRACTYCGKKDVPLEVEHIHPRSTGGSDRVSNLCLACHPCNEAKGNTDIKDFLAKKPDLLKKILAQAKAPLKDAAAVNATRWALFRRLEALGLPVECGTGGRTKYNRVMRNLPKAHWIDAACVGASTPQRCRIAGVRPLLITAHGHGTRQMCGTDKYGFPIRHRHRQKRHAGFQTGDMVRAVVKTGKKAGMHTGRVLVRATGSFDIRTKQGRVQGISHRTCTPVHRSDGYSYGAGASA
jgi:5-methylcytosine-specific restriction endonuclease McrA